MPFFKKKSRKEKPEISGNSTSSAAAQSDPSNGASALPTTTSKQPKSILRSTGSANTNQNGSSQAGKTIFSCQLAHGSPTGRISGFNNVKDLYEKIATYYEIPVSTILYCTLNTHKLDMDKLVGGQIGLDDLIFAHVKGQTKEVEMIKSEPTIGLTITDNGASYAFVKRIKPGSIADRMNKLVKAGDHIEKINEKAVVGMRHFEVAKILKDIPVGSKIVLRLVEPQTFDFPLETTRRVRTTGGNVKSGTKTLRFKANGQATIEEVDDSMTKAVEKINNLLETYMGINDSELSQQIWELAQNKKNPSDFVTAINESELDAFNFTDDFLFDIWAAIDDAKSGRIIPTITEESERL